MFCKCQNYFIILFLFYVYGLKCNNLDIKRFNYDVYCKFQPNSYDCARNGSMTPKFYYDLKMGNCKTSVDGGCKYNYNAFTMLAECNLRCTKFGLADNTDLPWNLTANIFCRLQPDFGKCNNYIPMFYYDVSQQQCRGFSYSGCGGNFNRFASDQLCKVVCIPEVEY